MYLVFKFFARTDVFFYLLLWLMVLLVLGTIAQKDVGLYAAQQIYFSSIVIWFGNILPLPGAYLTMIFIFLGLNIKLFSEKWKRKKAGTIIIHFGAILLLFGGFLTSQFSSEGFMMIPEGKSSNFITDYHDLELALTDISSNKVTVFDDKWLKQDSFLKSKELPFMVKIIDYCQNCSVVKQNNSKKLKTLPLDPKSEANRSGVSFSIDKRNEQYITLENMLAPLLIIFNELAYKVELRHKRTYLPFAIKLLDFEKQVHPNTNMARSYKSDVILQDDSGLEWQSRIQMNEPLRYKGYTFYQSSFIEGDKGDDVTVLAVVKNVGRLFPYISSIIMCFGLLVHLIQRLPALMGSKKTSSLLLTCLLVLFSGTDVKADEPLIFNNESFARISILHEGRIKPLDSFARIWLTTFSGRAYIEEISAIDWLAELLFNQNKAYFRAVFNISNPDVVFALSLEWREGHRYSFAEVSRALKANSEMIALLRKKSSFERSIAQNQLLDLNIRVLLFFEISRSVSLILPDLELYNLELSEKLGLPLNKKIIYKDLIRSSPVLLELLAGLKEKNNENLSNADRELIQLYQALQRFEHDRTTFIFKVVPPQWKDSGDGWMSPWEVSDKGQGSPQSADFLKSWQNMALAYRQGDTDLWQEQSRKALELSQKMAIEFVSPTVLDMEYYYNSFDLFKYSMFFYITAFIALLFGYLGWQKAFRKLSIILISSGAFLHVIGIAARMYIMARPPVATLYESIIFVGIIAVLFALFLEWRGKNGVGILIASIIGAGLHLIGTKYAAQGDSMGMLVAVLDTNFWLATHVITITIGYGLCFVAGLLAHIYLFMHAFYPKNCKMLKNIELNMLAAGLLALFFSILGTILGGIWADQSWGRFWGWDPKENGALLICLWLIFLLHGRIAGTLRSFAFAVGMVITNIIVALAWFGVNLLNVGLHTYGFTDNIAFNLALFTGIEITFIAMVWIITRLRVNLAT